MRQPAHRLKNETIDFYRYIDCTGLTGISEIAEMGEIVRQEMRTGEARV